MKRIVQVYKAGPDWVDSPPGLGDFVRGICHLHEKVQRTPGLELKVDLSQTGFSSLIEFDESIFQVGDPAKIASAKEFFVDHDALHRRFDEFVKSDERELYLCTNLGDWNRTTLPPETRAFGQKFYRFKPSIHEANREALSDEPYAVLSIRAGDEFYGEKASAVGRELKADLFRLIEKRILKNTPYPLVVTSDSFQLKCELCDHFQLKRLTHVSQHGAHGNAEPVARDMDLIKHSRFNFHINAWQAWWSGFSHYTSLLFEIPSVNFVHPYFSKQAVSPSGEVSTPLLDHLHYFRKRAKSSLSAQWRWRVQEPLRQRANRKKPNAD